MWDRFIYYVDLVVTLCGFDGSEGNDYFGWFMVLLSVSTVIYACYVAITKALWPGETDETHIKYRLFEDE